MDGKMLITRRFCAALLLLMLSAPAMGAGTIEGHWVLVEQHYGKGRSNFAPKENPVHLEFATVGTELTGKVWEGGDRAAAAAWPAFDAGDGLLPLNIEQRRIDRRAGFARAEYELQPSPTDDLILRVVEEYRLSDKGDALTGLVRISLHRGGRDDGGYVLHRRFERAP